MEEAVSTTICLLGKREEEKEELGEGVEGRAGGVGGDTSGWFFLPLPGPNWGGGGRPQAPEGPHESAGRVCNALHSKAGPHQGLQLRGFSGTPLGTPSPKGRDPRTCRVS